MYVPRIFLIAVDCFIVWRILSRVLTCQSIIGRILAHHECHVKSQEEKEFA
jgi:hypothetical protein